jgi:Polyketide cyclase / dehydrase and lipid transport
MWSKSHSLITKDATRQQMWKLFSNVNQWNQWDEGIDYAKMDGAFEVGNHIELKPKGGPKVKIKLVEAKPNEGFTDFTQFPGAKMYGKHEFTETPDGLKITTTMSIHGPLSFF